MAQKDNMYMFGKSESVLKRHGARSAASSAAYLLDSIRPDMHILDIGCGPGSITADLAALVPQGKVIGIDIGPLAIQQARKMASERGLRNITFAIGNAHALDFSDAVFDVVHAHQVLQHIGEPSHALSEWRRVTKSGGIIACRGADTGSPTYYPESKDLAEFQEMYKHFARSRGGEPNSGRRLVAWARTAGFERSKITATASVQLYSSPDERAWWADMWIDFIRNPDAQTYVLEGGHITEGDLKSDLDRYTQAWHEWAADEDGWWTTVNGEILCSV